MSTRSSAYLLARLLGDLQAARKGPRAMVMRLIRKSLWRQFGRTANRIR